MERISFVSFGGVGRVNLRCTRGNGGTTLSLTRGNGARTLVMGRRNGLLGTRHRLNTLICDLTGNGRRGRPLISGCVRVVSGVRRRVTHLGTSLAPTRTTRTRCIIRRRIPTSRPRRRGTYPRYNTPISSSTLFYGGYNTRLWWGNSTAKQHSPRNAILFLQTRGTNRVQRVYTLYLTGLRRVQCGVRCLLRNE